MYKVHSILTFIFDSVFNLLKRLQLARISYLATYIWYYKIKFLQTNEMKDKCKLKGRCRLSTQSICTHFDSNDK